MEVPVGSADVLPRLAARAWPHRAALRTGTRTVTFGELDRDVSRLAFGLRHLIGGDGLPVIVSATLGLDFPTAYYAVVRSGNVAIPANPRMPAETFAGLLADSGARVAMLGRVMYERVRRVLPPGAGLSGAGLSTGDSFAGENRRSPAVGWNAGGPRRPGAAPDRALGHVLEHVLLLDAPAEAGQLTCAELSTRGILTVDPTDRAEHAEAAAGRSHYAVKAAALARAGVLDPGSVVLNTTSSFHPDDLGAALVAGATQVLWNNPDPATALREAAAHRATHVWRDGDRAVRAVAS
ncbi:hypothetical protein BLA60_10845 [Actinophytocola xinjiangensis]|uniref:AMP-dependent synthetase/ligase domain-containing protein n=2 Tax=Actinophytocola xinjiangensis TaxID=485602 RepID=A0A7Z1AZQ7_9PSEU|nr:hypothetical protein BLA60_10845 [Actinophytocola xinjiangensis]